MLRYTCLLLLLMMCIEGSCGFLGSPNCQNRPSIITSSRARATAVYSSNKNNGNDDDDIIMSDLGEYDPSEGVTPKRQVNVGDPQIKVQDKERSVTSILKELAAIQQQGPQKYCILGTRHCSFLHQQIIELL